MRIKISEIKIDNLKLVTKLFTLTNFRKLNKEKNFYERHNKLYDPGKRFSFETA
jgi:hypothetical protein